MKKILYFIILMVVLSQAVFSDDFKEVEDKNITFKWKVEEDSLHIILSAPTTGWVGVGFNPSKVMKDADFKMAFVNNGNTVMEDRFGVGLFKLDNDTAIGGSSDFELITGSETNGVTEVEFTIPLNSGDEFDTVLNEGDEVKVLLAYGSSDDMSRKHKGRTSVMIEL